MPYKLSRCFCLQTPDVARARSFYSEVLGFKEISTAGQVEFDTPPVRLFMDSGPAMGPIFELIVPDLEQARQELLAAGCTVLQWEGKGKTCYVRDPFGFTFNLFEERN